MRNFFFSTALLPGGWADDVLVTCADGQITQVAAGQPCPADAERLEGAAISGIANLHSHAHQRAIAGLGERSGPGEDSFWSWREAMYRTVAMLDPDMFEAVTTLLYVEMLRAGYTSVAEFHYLHHAPGGEPYADPAEMSHRVIAAAGAAGIGLTLLPVLYAASGFGGGPPTEGQRRFACGIDQLLDVVARLRPVRGVVLGAAPHSLRAVPPAMLARLAAEVVGPIHIHVAEQKREVAECLGHTGQRPVAWLLDHAAVDARWCLIHATHVDDGELAAMARAGAVVGLCPTTEANLGDGVFPAAAFQRQGGRFGIGSDSHISVSPTEELRWLEYGQRLTLGRRAVLAGGPYRSTGRTLIETVARDGAAACGFEGGRIAPGARCDIVVLNLSLYRGDAVLDAAVFAGNINPVRHTIAAGRCVVRDGQHPLQDAAARRFGDVMRRLQA